ncbi:TetR/AcrR family transcriptional regulator [Cryobacterium glucosi]|uniref:TetR/AcrR family transcriptional regulator n=1 Tax=Cryobacterium glucosi TaxID=1259175 RepID=UPI001F540DEC|nr:TetR family transcriptional regulator [Cryobacterium glucosi]
MRRIPPAQRRDELIAAATRVIARDGLTAATTRAIVAEAGMPLGAFHYIFDSRDDLLTSVIDTNTEEQKFLVFTSVGTDQDRSVKAVLRAGLDAYIDWLVANPHRELALAELALYASRTGTAEAARTQYDVYYRSAKESLRRVTELTGQSWTVPVEQLARYLVAIVDGMTSTWLADRDTEAARSVAGFAAASLAGHASAPDKAATEPSDDESDDIRIRIHLDIDLDLDLDCDDNNSRNNTGHNTGNNTEQDPRAH